MDFFDIWGSKRSDTGIAFQVHSPDEHAPVHAANIGRYDGPSATLGGMSRPPSRANNKSPLSSVIDLTTDHPNGIQYFPLLIRKADLSN